MDKVWIFLLALCFVILQTTLSPILSFVGYSPDLVFLFVIFVALQKPNTLGIWSAFGSGLMLDIGSGSPLGLNSLLLIGIAYLVGYLRRQFFQENFTAQILIVMIFTIIHQFLSFFWMNTLMGTHLGFGQCLGKALLLGLMHAIIAPFLYQWLGRFIHGEDAANHLVTNKGNRLGRLK